MEKETISDRIMLLIDVLNLTTNSFSIRLNIAPTAVYHIEKGRNKPGYNLIANIAKTFNVNCNWLILGKGRMFNEQ